MVLQARGVDFGYPGVDLFGQLDLRVPPGLSLVLGGDGRGKTTLLRLLAAELTARAGTFTLAGVDLASAPVAYRRQAFWVNPRSDEHDQTTVADCWRAVAERHDLFDHDLLPDLIEGLSLGEHVHKPMYMLSTGSKRKVWIAAAFAAGAPLTLLDDPFAALDRPSIGFVTELLAEAAAHPSRAWVMTGYEAPGDLPLASLIRLGD